MVIIPHAWLDNLVQGDEEPEDEADREEGKNVENVDNVLSEGSSKSQERCIQKIGFV